MYNFKPKLAEVDADAPNMWARCDRCGFITNIDKMVWQYDFRGTPQPINTRILTCGRPSCLDVAQVQNSPIILSPDPEPVFNARPFPYEVTESSWLITQDGDVITTQDGSTIGTAFPNPTGNAATAHLEALVQAPGADVSVLYLDIFDGDPAGSGVSVLEEITGSTTRTNIASQLTTVGDLVENADYIVVTTEAEETVNTNHIAFYDAATGGNLLMSGPLNVNGPLVTIRNPVVFDPIALRIDTSTGIPDGAVLWGDQLLVWGDTKLVWG